MTNSFDDVTDAAGTMPMNDSGSQAVLRFGGDLECIYVDATFTQWFGGNAAGFVGKRLQDGSLPAPLDGALADAAHAALRTGETFRTQVNWSPTGQEGSVSVLAIPERAGQASPHAVSLILTVLGSASPVGGERAARVRVEAALFARDKVLSIISHDLRGPLNAIHSWAYVLERKIDSGDAGVQRALTGIRTGVEQQVKLIEQVLDTARAGTKHLQLNRSTVPVDTLVDEAVQSVRASLAQARDVVFELDLEGAGQRCAGDPERLWQAAWTVFAYAVDLSGPGACVRVASTVREGLWQVQTDFIPSVNELLDESLPHAFEAFCRADAALPQGDTRRDFALALPIKVIDAHGGQFAIQSSATGGATLSWTLPLAGAVPSPT